MVKTDNKTTFICFMSNSGKSGSDILNTDAFIFENDSLERLDSYQRFNEVNWPLSISSGSGNKLLFLICNYPKEKYAWADIRSFSSLNSVMVDLENESRIHPIMTYQSKIIAGKEQNIKLTPLMSEILIRSIKCDFSNEPYSGEKLRDVKAYLTYVNASCCITDENNIVPSRVINAGRLEADILKGFKDSTLIARSLAQEIGIEGIYPDVSLLCYPNNSSEDSLGSRFTRLVIEGKIGNDTYYYPIKINHFDGGIRKGCRYCFDISICRTGTTDPDKDIEDCICTVELEIKDWKENDRYSVRF